MNGMNESQKPVGMPDDEVECGCYCFPFRTLVFIYFESGKNAANGSKLKVAEA